MDLSGRTVLITGGSSGIGLTLAQQLLAHGSTVIITGRKQAKLDAAKQAHPALHIYQSDVASIDDVVALADKLEAEHPALDVLVNNAGVFHYQNLTVPADDLAYLTVQLDINLAGTIRMTSRLIELLKKNKGTIVNVSSGLAYVPLTCAPIYCATKAALHSYSVSLRFQLQDHGVRVVELLPPATRTALVDEVPEDGAFQIMELDDMIDATIKGLKADADEIRPGQAKQLYWMSRIAPGFINGQLYKGSKALIPPA